MSVHSFSAMSDEELVSLASADDQEAFACLFGRFNAMIYGKAVAKSRRCGGDLTDDMAQEAAIGFLNAVRSYDASKGVSFRTFAEHCVENVLVSAVRGFFSGNQALLKEHAPLDDSEYSGASAVSSDDPEGYVVDAASGSELAAHVFSGLTELERSVVEMRLRDLSYEETARALGISVKSVDNAIQRVRQKLRS